MSEYRQGLPAVEDVRAHEAKGGKWMAHVPDAESIHTPVLTSLYVFVWGDDEGKVMSRDRDSRDCEWFPDALWRPCSPDGTPLPWPGAASKPTDEQPAPTPERPDLPAVWDLVIADLGMLGPPPLPPEPDVNFIYGTLIAVAHTLAAMLGTDLVADMRERDATGRARYGVPLQPHNGREALKDMYQEILDSIVYGRQHLYEQAGGE